MKIIITEHQLDKIIDRYIALEVGNIDSLLGMTNKKVALQYFNRNYPKKILFNIFPDGNIRIHDSLLDEVSNVFGLNYINAEDRIEQWIKKQNFNTDKLIEFRT